MADKSSHEDIAKSAKLAKFEEETSVVSFDDQLSFGSFNGFIVKRILKENPENRLVVVEGTFNSENSDNVAHPSSLVILEKTHFTENEIQGILTGETEMQCLFNNDVYYNLLCHPPNQLNRIKATVIHPATQKHIKKYSNRTSFLIEETSLVYQNVTLPHITESKFDLQVS